MLVTAAVTASLTLVWTSAHDGDQNRQSQSRMHAAACFHSFNKYTDSFKVKGNTTVTAYIKKITKTYDDESKKVVEKESYKYD